MTSKRILFILIIIFSCTSTKKVLDERNIVFSKKEIGKVVIYTLDSPELPGKSKTIYRMVGGHGHGFEIVYSDLQTIYYSNDYGIATPNHKNYATIGWKGFKFMSGGDTIFNGRQTNGLYWKEIKKGLDYIGYLNVTDSNKNLFDSALLTFKKI